jgi:hypothetical protein
MAFDEAIKSATIRLGVALRRLPYVQSVGVGEEHGRSILIVYVRRLPKKDDGIPKAWEGFPVQVKRLGKVSPGNVRRSGRQDLDT